MKAKKFRRVYVEITGFCGLNCQFCPPKTRNSKKISLEKFEKLSAQLSCLTDELSLHLMGDPLSLPNLSEYLDITLAHSLIVNITTSGLFLPSHQKLLLGHMAVRQINFSLNDFHGIRAEINFDNYIKPILEFCKEASLVGDRFINLRLWNGSQNPQDLAFRNSAVKSIEIFFEARIDTNKKRSRVAPRVIVDFDDYFEWPSLDSNDIMSSFCLGLSDHFGILSDGSVVPCCLDCVGCIKLGNAFEQDLESILSSSRSRWIIDGFKEGVAVEELCKKCSYRARFA